jgi:hypothetical protein
MLFFSKICVQKMTKVCSSEKAKQNSKKNKLEPFFAFFIQKRGINKKFHT